MLTAVLVRGSSGLAIVDQQTAACGRGLARDSRAAGLSTLGLGEMLHARRFFVSMSSLRSADLVFPFLFPFSFLFSFLPCGCVQRLEEQSGSATETETNDPQASVSNILPVLSSPSEILSPQVNAQADQSQGSE